MIVLDGKTKRLVDAVRKAQEHTEEVNQQRSDLVNDLCGQFFDGQELHRRGFNGETAKDMQLAMVYTTVIALRPLLAIDPLPRFSSPEPELAEFAKIFQDGVEYWLKQANVGHVMRDLVVQMLFGQGILVSGVAPSTVVGDFSEANGYLEDPGEFFVRCVPAEDFVYDYTARTWDDCMFMGHYQTVPKQFAAECGLYDREAVLEMRPIRNMSETEAPEGYLESYFDEIRLLHLYLPHTRRLVTLPGELSEVKRVGVLSSRDYEGPEGGPYDRISFLDKPGTVKPIPLVSQFVGLHRAMNSLAAKMIDRALREKDNPTGNFADKKALEAMVDAVDGQGFLTDGGKVEVVSTGGVSQSMLAGAAQISDWYNRHSLNTDVLGGLAPQSKTLGQDAQLLESAGVKIEDLQGEITKLAKNLCKKAAYWLWKDEFAEFSLGGSVKERWEPGYREGSFEDYNFDVAVFVGQADTASQQYALKSGFVRDVLLPLVPAAQVAGKTLNVDKITELGADLGIENPSDFWVEAYEPPQVPVGSVHQGGDDITINAGQQQQKSPYEIGDGLARERQE